MKKITPKQYAQSLYESIKDSPDKELTKRIKNFLFLLKKRKDLKLLNKIFQSFVENYQRSKGIITAEVVFSREFEQKVKEEIIHWFKEQTNRTVELKENIEPDILGGVIIKYGDTVVDASLKNSLKNLQIMLRK